MEYLWQLDPYLSLQSLLFDMAHREQFSKNYFPARRAKTKTPGNLDTFWLHETGTSAV